MFENWKSVISWSVGVARFNTSPCHGEDHGFKSRTDRFLLYKYQGKFITYYL